MSTDLCPKAMGARLSADQKHRFLLWRIWQRERPLMLWILENPSTADANVDDPTIRRCTNFARRENCGGLLVVNLLSQRSTDPRQLRAIHDPPAADECIRAALALCETVVVGWGAGPAGLGADVRGVLALREAWIIEAAGQAGREMLCLGQTKDGFPRHPLYVAGNVEFVRWNWEPRK